MSGTYVPKGNHYRERFEGTLTLFLFVGFLVLVVKVNHPGKESVASFLCIVWMISIDHWLQEDHEVGDLVSAFGGIFAQHC